MDQVVGVLFIVGVVMVSRLILRKSRAGEAVGASARGSAVAGLTALAAASAFERSGNTLSEDWVTDPSYWFMSGNIYHRDQFEDNIVSSTDSSSGSSHDWYTDPLYSWMPGNIYYQDSSFSSDGSDFSSPDYINDPTYSSMPGNIFNHDDCMGIASITGVSWSASTSDDDMCSSTSSLSTFDDDSTSSFSGSSDDTWNSSSSSFNDD